MFPVHVLKRLKNAKCCMLCKLKLECVQIAQIDEPPFTISCCSFGNRETDGLVNCFPIHSKKKSFNKFLKKIILFAGEN